LHLLPPQLFGLFHANLLLITACMMNFITYDTAYSIYPRATFINYESITICDQIIVTPLSHHPRIPG
jgi:hypothetical protein